MTIRNGIIDAIGNTPLIKLKRASEETGCTILGKAEFLNPGQSVKDRAALAIVEDAERKGQLQPGRRHRRGHGRQYRHRPRLDRRREGLSRHRRDAAHAEPGKEGRCHRARRRTGRSGCSARRQRQPLPQGRAPARRGESQDRTQRRHLGQPVRQRRQPPGPSRHHGAGDLARHSTARSMASSARWVLAARWAASAWGSRPRTRTSSSASPIQAARRSTIGTSTAS